MPTYDYKCSACGHTFDRYQSITAGAVRKCPRCGRLKVRRLLGCGSGILFKGSGFYQTDYPSESYRKGAAKESRSSSATQTQGGETQGAEGKGAEGKGAETKGAEGKGGETKGREGKGGEGRGGETKGRGGEGKKETQSSASKESDKSSG